MACRWFEATREEQYTRRCRWAHLDLTAHRAQIEAADPRGSSGSHPADQPARRAGRCHHRGRAGSRPLDHRDSVSKFEGHLNSGLNTLGYPQAALFGFCLELVAFNLYALVMAALRATHPEAKVDETVSEYSLAAKIARTTKGLARGGTLGRLRAGGSGPALRLAAGVGSACQPEEAA